MGVGFVVSDMLKLSLVWQSTLCKRCPVLLVTSSQNKVTCQDHANEVKGLEAFTGDTDNKGSRGTMSVPHSPDPLPTEK